MCAKKIYMFVFLVTITSFVKLSKKDEIIFTFCLFFIRYKK